jgi:hypothetical protein
MLFSSFIVNALNERNWEIFEMERLLISEPKVIKSNIDFVNSPLRLKRSLSPHVRKSVKVMVKRLKFTSSYQLKILR